VKDHKVRVAVVGLGFGLNLLRALGSVKNARVAAIYDENRAKLEQLARKYKCRAAASYQEILDDKTIDAVVIATPNIAHKAQVLAALRAGKHVFVDKPIANTLAEAFAMRHEAKKRRLVLAVGHNSRHQLWVQKVKKLLAQQALGQVTLVETNFSSDWGLRLTPAMWRWYRTKCPSGPLMQLGVHKLDTLIHLFGPIVNVTALFKRLATPAQIDDTTVVAFEFKSGILGYNGSGYTVAPAQITARICGTKATVVLNAFSLDFQHYRKGAKWRKVPVIKRTPLPYIGDTSRATFVTEMTHFVDAAAGKKTPYVTADEAIRVLAVVEAAIQSQKTGHAVEVGKLVKKYDKKFKL
jgi:predicted dehydrogenase